MKIGTKMYNEMVGRHLYEDMDSTSADDQGNKAYAVKVSYWLDPENDQAPTETMINVRADSPESAKAAAASAAAEMNLANPSIVDVTFVPNSDEGNNDYGSGEPFNTDAVDTALDNMVPHADVSDTVAGTEPKVETASADEDDDAAADAEEDMADTDDEEKL